MPTEFTLLQFYRINVVGTSGSGKSTFCRKLAEKLKYPHIEMDRIFWRPNWTEPTNEEFFEDLRRALEPASWILDGNYTRSVPVKWERVELVIWLDYSFPRTLFQAVERAARRAWTKEELWPNTGNRESFRKSFFTKQSIIWWTIRQHGPTRKKYETYLTDPKFAHIKFIRLKNHREAAALLGTNALHF